MFQIHIQVNETPLENRSPVVLQKPVEEKLYESWNKGD